MPPRPLAVGLQLHLPTYRDLPLAQVLAVGSAADEAGFDQLWVTDNLENRDQFVVLGALAGVTGVPLGTAVSVQYLRNPLILAMAAATVGELLGSRPLVIALGAGNPFTVRSIAMPRRAAFMQETAAFLRRLWDGALVRAEEFPLVGAYFHLSPTASFSLPARAPARISLFGGGNGPRGLALAGEALDGLIFGWRSLPEARLGTLVDKIEVADRAAARAGRGPVRRVMEVKISIARDDGAARRWVRAHSASTLVVSLRRRGYSDEQLSRLGIDPGLVTQLDAAVARGEPVDELEHLVTDAMVDATFVAGDPEHCRNELETVFGVARTHGFEQVVLSELGPDPLEAIALIGEHLDALRRA